MEQIEKYFFEDCLNNGIVSTYTGKSLENLHIITKKIAEPDWAKIVSYVENANKAFDHVEMGENLLFYLKKYIYSDEIRLKNNLSRLVKIISSLIPLGELYNFGYELEFQPCVCCGEVATEPQTIKTYLKPFIQVPVCKNCLEEEPNKDRVIELLALRANALQNRYEQVVEPITVEEPDNAEYIFKG